MMQRKMMWLALAMIGGLLLSGGCQDYKKKYDACMAEKENQAALLESSQDALKQCQSDMEASRQQFDANQKNVVSERGKGKGKAAKDDFVGENAKWDEAKGTITVELESDVLFDSGKVLLKKNAQTRLDKIAGTIKDKYAGKEIYVIGHTDADPIHKSKWADNWELSAERALAVTRYLVKHGVSPKQLVAAGRGENQPGGGKKAQNRRVEIVVHTY
jgi:chemotaxis protein MotB